MEVTFHTRDPFTGRLINTADLVVVLRSGGTNTTPSVANPSTGKYVATFATPSAYAELIASTVDNADECVVWRTDTTPITEVPDEDVSISKEVIAIG